MELLQILRLKRLTLQKEQEQIILELTNIFFLPL